MDIDILPDEIIREIISWINYITPLTHHLLPTLNKRWAKLALSLRIAISNYKQYRHAIKRGDYLSLISSSFPGPDHNEWRFLLVKQGCKSGWLGIASALVHKLDYTMSYELSMSAARYNHENILLLLLI